MTPERIRALLQRGVDQLGGTHTLDDVLAIIARGDMQLWVGDGCVAVTEVLNFPRKIVISVFLGAGSLRNGRALQAGIEAFGRGRGATALQWLGKATPNLEKYCGWKAAGDQTARPGWVVYTKEI